MGRTQLGYFYVPHVINWGHWVSRQADGLVQSAQDDVPNMFDTLTGMTRRLGTALVLNPCAYTYGFPGGSDSEASTCNAGDLGSILGLGRSPRKGKGYLLQYSGLENSMNCIVHGVTKSWTQLNDFHFQEWAKKCMHGVLSHTGKILEGFTLLNHKNCLTSLPIGWGRCCSLYRGLLWLDLTLSLRK